MRVDYTPGCERNGDDVELCHVKGYPAEARSYAKRSDLAVVVLGYDSQMEGEQGDTGNTDAAGDRFDIRLPDIQLRLLKTVLDTGTPTVVVLIHGGAVTLQHEGAFLEDRCVAILDAFYPGPHGGTVLADILLGKVNPSGRLPTTTPRDVADLPPFEDYAMAGRTYRFADPAKAAALAVWLRAQLHAVWVHRSDV